MLEGVSQCIFQLDKAEKAGAADTKIAGTISLEWGSRDTRSSEAICSLPTPH